MGDQFNCTKAANRLLLIIFGLTLLFFGLKVWVAWTTRSLCLFAESLRAILDCFSTLLSLLTLSAFPQPVRWTIWSHRRRETLMVLLLVALMGFGGFNLLGLSLLQLYALWQEPTLETVAPISPAFIFLLFALLLVQWGMLLFERHEANVLQSVVLRVNARQMLQDVGVTGSAIAGVVGAALGLRWLDPLLTLGLLLLVSISLWRLLSWQMPSLVRQVIIAPETLAKLVGQIEGVAACSQIRTQGLVGKLVFVQMRLRLRPEFQRMAQTIVARLEHMLRERYGAVETEILIDIDFPSNSP
ncbi:cation transporter [Leptolyngbya ohadii]|uniref:cation transporter n=1 Tax=Leptolyngbya ohadii TaxID=1962290 RepID=UPI000B59EA50|nr:cation transporter [Leptolyngbya ohadii]